MNLYKQKLIDEGFAKNNAERLASAINTLHSAICKMDKHSYNEVFSLKSLRQRLVDFATIEELRIIDVNNRY